MLSVMLCATLIVRVRGMPYPKLAQLITMHSWDLEPLVLLNGLALGCFQPSSEVLIVLGLPDKGRTIKGLVVCYVFRNTVLKDFTSL